MARNTRHQWFSWRRFTSQDRAAQRSCGTRPLQRRLRIEPLEERWLLANVTVGNTNDIVNGNVTSIAALIATPGADGISLRESIQAANATAGADEVTFDAALSGQTIALGGTELAISEALVIDARPLAANVTIDANEQSRIFNITATTGDFTLGGLTLTGGRTTGNNLNGSDTTFNGGAIRSLTTGNLTLDQSTVSGNSTVGIRARGGGIYAYGDVTLTQSTVSGNSTVGDFAIGGGINAYGDVTLSQSTVSGNSSRGDNAFGGGIVASIVTLTQSTVSGNSTRGDAIPYVGSAGGGGISAYTVTLTESTVSGNSTAGSGADGGGISAVAVTLTRSTVSGNSTVGDFAIGGGILAHHVTLTQSTVSGNSTAGSGARGGGIVANHGNVTLTQSTVTNNHAMHASSTGGGIYQFNSTFNPALSISGSIVAGNTAGGSGADLVKDPDSTLTVNYSLIGTGITPTAGGNNVVTNAPQLGPLANNGGPTQTHALLAGSPAIDAGDPNIVFNPAEFDQRGQPFVRVFDGDAVPGARIDIGSFELQPIPSAFYGDYNQNGVGDAADYVVWRKTLGLSGVTQYSGADGNGNGVVNEGDRVVWAAHFGQTLPPPAAASAAAEMVESVAQAAGASGEETSVSLHVVESKLAVEVRGGSGEEQAPSQRENPSPVLIVPASLLSPYRPAVRLSHSPTAMLAASRRDDALLACLAQPVSNQDIKDWQELDKWENEEACSAGDMHVDSVDHVFALLASG